MVSERDIDLQWKKKSVCVIGAGPAGLVAARELRKEGHNAIVLEQNRDVGGQWLYDPNVENEDPLGKTSNFVNVHSSVYASLRLASPREIMGYSDFPFLVKKGRDTRRFPGHEELFLYLKDFCDWFGLREMIRFNIRVEYVGMLDSCSHQDHHHDHHHVGKEIKWVVRSRDHNNINNNNDDGHDHDLGILVEQVFDAVVVASGHFSHPRLPNIKGMDKWKGRQIHSHVYRVPEPFRDEVVVVVGNSQSGQDITLDILEVAKEIHVSTKSMDTITQGLSKVINKHQNLHLQPQIESLEDDGRVLFVDGSSIVADTILYCTGYSYSFPFLDTKGIVYVDDNRVGPLYEHTFPPSLAPSLSFMGIPRKLIGFPFFESQAIWIAQLLSGKRTLPSWDDMMQSIKELYHSQDIAGIPKHNTHDLADFEYCDKYGDNVGYPHLEEWRKKLCLSCLINYLTNLETFRDLWDDDDDLQEAFQSPHFTQLGPQVCPL